LPAIDPNWELSKRCALTLIEQLVTLENLEAYAGSSASTHLTATLPAKPKPFTASGLGVSGFDEETEAIGPTVPTQVGMLHALTEPY
jgi:hypothetical protein